MSALRYMVISTLIVFAAETTAQTETAGPGPQLPEGILVYETDEGRMRWWFDFRVQVDAAYYVERSNTLNSGTELRRGRFAVKTLLRGWYAELDVDVADNELDINDAWIGRYWNRTSVRFGQYREPFSLGKTTSSRYITFMERAMPLLPGGLPIGSGSRKIGLGLYSNGERWFAAGGVFGQEVEDVDEGDDEGIAVTARGVLTPWNRPGRVLHLGLAGTIRTPDANTTGSDQVRFRTRPETHVNRERFLDTGGITGVDYTTGIGLEGALVWGPYSVQTEIMSSRLHRSGAANPNFEGGYVFVSWFPTGESRTYNIFDGEFFQVIPQRETGALELALRYSTIDLNDFGADILGGEAENVTFGVNWYASQQIRIMANATYVNNDRRADGGSPSGSLIGGDDFGFVQMRFQINF